ncbi:MAG TPA: HAD-IA family hydrolase [Xanthomonadales bacterium]|nr:HAD-IA family hydrolase [Xanthomonadales bacterium]
MIRGVLFDLDGTLLDSAPDLVGSLNFLRAEHELEALSVRKMESAASAGAVSLLQAGMPQADAETFERWRMAFLAHYEKNSFVNSVLYEGAYPLLEYFQMQGISWGIVTNKSEYLTHPILKAASLDESIATVVCGDTTPEMKPHPAPVILACEELGLEPEQVLFVGDDPRDLQAGRAAGVRNCAAMYGYGAAHFEEPEHASLLEDAITIHGLGDLLVWFRQNNG